MLATAPAQTSRPADPDAGLIAKILAGDTVLFNELVERHWSLIFARVYGLLNQVQDAEEVTQDTFARAYRNLHMFRGEAAFASWLYQIGTNLARNRYWHGRRRGAGRTLSLDQPCSESGNSLHAYLACSKPGPIEAALLCETIRALRRAYPRLPANYREILSLRLREDLSYEDIAQRLAVPLGTVKSRLARARQALAESIAA